MLAETPQNQTERLATLGSYNVLDSGQEQNFDEIVRLVARICDAPVALISIVDKDRQWFKARYGFDASETPLDRSVCSHAILHEDLTEIEDTLKDPRTLDNPLCVTTKDPLRFYAGAPLVTAAGIKLGTLCVLDFKPRVLTDLQRETLRVLADQVMQQLELRRALANEAVLRHEIDHRVKNSLQTVMSFIRLYGSRSGSDDTREALEAIGRRVSAIAQLHSELYQTSEFDQIRLDRYLSRVIGLLDGTTPENVSIRTEIAPISVDSRIAATLAMIVSEFSANAIKHAFPNGRPGEISICLEGIDPEGLRLVCRDNGVGNTLDGGDPPSSPVSIGKRLMASAAEQIGGEMSLDAGAGGYCLTLVKLPQPQPQQMSQADAP